MTDMQTKQFLKILSGINKNLAELVKETKRQNKLTMEMIQAAENLDAAEAEYYDEDFAEVNDGEIVPEEEESNDE